MAYALGVLENAIKQVKDRLDSYTATGKSLVDIKSILIGSRPIETANNTLPRIIINLDSFADETYTMASSGGQKQATLNLEIRLIAEKLMATSGDAKYANNILFDSAGNGILVYFQNMIDALVFKSDDTYSPTLDLQLDTFPDVNFTTEETGKTIEVFAIVPLKIRYTLGGFGGITT